MLLLRTYYYKNAKCIHMQLGCLSAHVRAFMSTDAVESDALPRSSIRKPEVLRNGVAVIRIDGPGKVNTISSELPKEIRQMWQKYVAPDERIKAVVWISDKPGSFIHGADIGMIKDAQGAKGIPIVAAIQGACLGGGLEFALHCDYRIASTDEKTVFGLPEVKLGLLPGWGGTQFLPALLGLRQSLDLMLTGKSVRPVKAKNIGLVDQLADPHALLDAAVGAAETLIDRKERKKLLSKRRRSPMSVDGLLERIAFLRGFVMKKAREKVTATTKGKYPAPLAILDCVEYGMKDRKKKREALEYESGRFSELAESKESKALISIYDGSTSLKKNPFGVPEPRTETIAVLGAGQMGAGIAEVSANNGLNVMLKDRDEMSLAKGLKQIKDSTDKKLKRKRITKFESELIASRIVPLSDEECKVPLWQRHFAKVELVVEAVPEVLSLKHAVLEQVEKSLSDDCVLATNTSSIRIEDVANGTSNSHNVVGMHYFSPVTQMPLLEIIPHSTTSERAIMVAVDVGLRQGKTPIVVKDVPGFYMNRCFGPYTMEACALIEEGVGLWQLDRVMKSYGLPVGPITLADEVGIDTVLHVFGNLSQDMGTRMEGASITLLKEMVDANLLGRKTGKGFYIYNKEKNGGLKALFRNKKEKSLNDEAQAIIGRYQTSTSSSISDEEMQHRLISRFVNEAVLCLQEGIISSPIDGDIGAVFGFGFPPFLGGPFHMLDHWPGGISAYVHMMNGFSKAYGNQFQPCELLQDMAATNSTRQACISCCQSVVLCLIHFYASSHASSVRCKPKVISRNVLLNQRSELDSVWNEAFHGLVTDVEYASKQYAAKMSTTDPLAMIGFSTRGGPCQSEDRKTMPSKTCIGEETPSGSLDNAVVPDASKPSARTHSDVKQVDFTRRRKPNRGSYWNVGLSSSSVTSLRKGGLDKTKEEMMRKDPTLGRYACEFCSSRQTTYVALGDTVFHGRKTEIWGAGGDSALMVEVRCEDCGGRSKMEHG